MFSFRFPSSVVTGFSLAVIPEIKPTNDNKKPNDCVSATRVRILVF